MEVKTTFGRALVEIAKNECDLGRKFLHELLSITEQLISVACTLWCLVLEEKKPSAFSRGSFLLVCLIGGTFKFRVTDSALVIQSQPLA